MCFNVKIRFQGRDEVITLTTTKIIEPYFLYEWPFKSSKFLQALVFSKILNFLSAL